MDANELARIAAFEMQFQGLRPEFSPEVLREAEATAGMAPQAGSGALDLRERLWFSIDNDDTRDLDQLSWAEARPDGSALVSVAVAEVDVFAPRGGALDEHAAANTTSVYTAAGVFPMLPKLLSNDRSSLHAGVDRLAVVVDMTIDAAGEVQSARIYRALVRNRAKLAYDSVAAWLDGTGPAPAEVAGSPELQAQIHLHDRVASSLRHWRHRRGALNVATAQARPVFEQGELVDLRADHKNRA